VGQRGEGKGTLRTFIFSFIIGGNENGDVGLQICFEYGQDTGVLLYGAVYTHTLYVPRQQEQQRDFLSTIPYVSDAAMK